MPWLNEQPGLKARDAWQPLAETLDASRKHGYASSRCMSFVRWEIRVESRRMMFEDIADED